MDKEVISRLEKNMVLETIVVGEAQANCYLVGCSQRKEAILIDPGDDSEKIKRVVQKRGLEVNLIINTHGHRDHIGANHCFRVPVWIHRDDANFLSDPQLNLSMLFGEPYVSPSPARYLEDGDRIKVGELVLEVIHTPGHTPGGICLNYNNIIFTGDTLFCGGVGRTDLPYGSDELLIKSIEERLLNFGDEVVIYPGHGSSSTIGRERRNNPFIRL